MSETVLNKTERPNSYEVGKAGARFKLFFETSEDLAKMIDDLQEKGLWSEI